jgi:uncharacterized protein
MSLISLTVDTAVLDRKYESLQAILRDMGSVLVAFSGGADSALLLRVAHDVLGDRAVGVIAVSETIPEAEVADAQALAREIGVDLRTVRTNEMEREGFRANGPDRCYHCKQELFTTVAPLASELGLAWLAYGANEDDLGDYRPGQQAARDWQARAPLQEAKLTKQEIRTLSRRLHLRTWNKPAMACLSSRIPHGTAIDVATLHRIEAAERILRQEGFAQVRVRTHGEIARLEVAPEDLPRLVAPDLRTRLAAQLHQLGYRYITLDLDGFRSGSMNPVQEQPPSHT